jgi:cell division protein FtsZ
MDEVEVIQNYLLSQAGDNTDVILGMGYDSNLEDKLGITLIATGFQHKDPFAKNEIKKVKPKEEKIVMVLGQEEEKKSEEELKPVAEEKTSQPDPKAPKLVEEIFETPMPSMADWIEPEIKEEENIIIHWELKPEEKKVRKDSFGETKHLPLAETKSVDKMWTTEKKQEINSQLLSQSGTPQDKQETSNKKDKESASTTAAASGGYLARPSNIYAETKAEVFTSTPSAEEPVPSSSVANKEEEELFDLQMQLVERDDIPAADVPLAHQAQSPLFPSVEDPTMLDETEEQKRRAAERLKKLRNLSFNVNTADPNNEFETVPAYIRRNMELHSTGSAPENFYSNYEVKTDENNRSQISTINTFLDGKKPD